ncbi:MAG: MFS transporter [Candidatus Bathyarchaeota archaeon]|jgi:predicted MFS family arabinose efflux permease|nr:MAG: MFS transporter [Candidatus Bathyarchaeota archaeon]
MEKPLWIIYTTHMFIEINLLIQVALIPVIIQEFQLNILEASLIATIPSLVALLMNIPSGILADRVSANYLLFASMLIEGLSAFFVSQTNSFWILVLGVSLMRVSSPIYHIPGLSQISRLAGPDRISRSIGYHNALGNLGTAAGVVSLTLFLSTVGWRWTYLFWSFPILAWGLVVLTSSKLKAAQIRNKGQDRLGLKRLRLIFSSGLLLFLIVVGLREIGSTGSLTFMTTYFVTAGELSEATASLIFGLGPFIGIVGSLYSGFLAERISPKRTLSLAILSCAVSLAILSQTSTIYLVSPTYMIYSFSISMVWAPINTIIAQLTPATERGLSYSFYFFTEGLIASFAPTLAAGVIELTNIFYVLPFAASFLIASVVLLQFLPERTNRPELE